MQDKPIHIISFDNPFPPVYGGVVDVFYRMKALHELGFSIYLHCFVNVIPTDYAVLKQYTKEIYFYKRPNRFLSVFSMVPFSVLSRRHKDLIVNIEKTAGAVHCEGLQSSYSISKGFFKDRVRTLRLLNLEDNYYQGLANSERNLMKKLFFRFEAMRYKSYQNVIKEFDAVFTISVYETDYVTKHFRPAQYIPVFHGNKSVADLSSFGNYALYHGDMGTADNRRAVEFLIDVFKKIPDCKFIIASSKHGEPLEKLMENAPNISFVSIKSQQHLDELLAGAHINVMLSFQQSGTKLKVINSLFKGRFCIINKNMVDDPAIRDLCTMAETEADFIEEVNRLKSLPYDDYQKRKVVMSNILDDNKNAALIDEIIMNL